MSPDIEDMLRSELRGAASGAPHDLGVDDQDVLTRGRRVVVRRRVLTVAGVATATLAIAGTIGVLAPQLNNDALPAIPTPTVTPTADPSPTITSSASPTATPTASATASATSTPTSTPSFTSSSTGKPSRTNSPSATSSRTKTPSPSTTPPAAGTTWSSPFTVAGASYRARLVASDPDNPKTNYGIVVEANGRQSALFPAYYESECCRPASDRSDAQVFYVVAGTAVAKIISVNGEAVTSQVGSVVLPAAGTHPGDGSPRPDVTVTVVRSSVPITLGPTGDEVIVRYTNGFEGAISGHPDSD